ncbi:putative glycolipid-binding domain-containing protein [Pseudomonas sp. NCHU5208]|uniref:putative glycolipid-binding domain-containing protein n=1 Tax=unclassified Pseudomonas TaxID=196821 RepID=UPI003F985AE9
MQQTLVWKPWHTPGVESLRLTHDDKGIHAASHLMQVIRGESIAASYLIDCNPQWQFRRLWLKVENHGQRRLCLRRDEQGNWLVDGVARPDLQGCQHIMLSASPFTHTPILQCCDLQAGQSQDMQVVYIDLPSLQIQVRQQRYECLSMSPEESFYHSQTEGCLGEELEVDGQTLLLNANERYMCLSQRELKLNALA